MPVGAVVIRDVVRIAPGAATSTVYSIDLFNQHEDGPTNNMSWNVEATYNNFNANLSYCVSIQHSCKVTSIAGGLFGLSPATFTHPERYGLAASNVDMTFSVLGTNLQITVSVPNCGGLTGHLAFRLFGSPG